MSVKTEWGMCCPKCGDDSELDIEAKIMVRLTEDGTDADESREGDHVWDGNSVCTCECGWGGTVAEAEDAAKQFQKLDSLGWYYEADESEWRKTDESAPDGYRYAATAADAMRQESAYFGAK